MSSHTSQHTRNTHTTHTKHLPACHPAGWGHRLHCRSSSSHSASRHTTQRSTCRVLRRACSAVPRFQDALHQHFCRRTAASRCRVVLSTDSTEQYTGTNTHAHKTLKVGNFTRRHNPETSNQVACSACNSTGGWRGTHTHTHGRYVSLTLFWLCGRFSTLVCVALAPASALVLCTPPPTSATRLVP